MPYRIPIAAILIACAPLCLAPAAADCLHLKSGGTIQGTWINRSPHPRQYHMATPLGRMIVAAEEVARYEGEREAAAEYRRRAPLTADTVEAQWELATWCRDNDLHDERTAHLRRVVALDGDHTRARQLLGFTYHGGQWIERDDLMLGKGYVRWEGRWRMGQEVELNQRRAEREQAEIDWLVRLRRMRSALATDDARSTAEEFAAIRDPHAVPGLRQLLAEDRWQSARLGYLLSLRRIGTPAALAVLFDASILDYDREIRLTALEHLSAIDPPGLAREYVKVLKSENNVEINRAAAALKHLNDPSTISPLVDALLTTHTVVLPGGGSPDTMTTTFSPDGGAGFKSGGGAKRISGQVQNAAVLDALTRIAGRSFGFDQAAWRAWLAAEAQAELNQTTQ